MHFNLSIIFLSKIKSLFPLKFLIIGILEFFLDKNYIGMVHI